MTEREVNDISRAIGALESTVSQLMRMWEHNDREATEGRRALYKKFDDLKDATTSALSTIGTQITQINARVDAIVLKVDGMEPSITRFKEQHQQGIGSKKTLALIWAALVGIIGATAGAAVEIVHLLWPMKPH